MRFCPTCGTRLKLKKVQVEGGVMAALICDRCGHQEREERPKVEIITPSSEGIKVVGSKEGKIKTMPTITAECPKCGNKEAYWWLLQTRSVDEPSTQFYRCTKCEHTWRQYA